VSFRFHLCGSSREVIQSCTARDIHDARNILNPREDLQQFVVSDASLQLGLGKPLAPHICLRCGIRPKVVGYDDCKPCRARVRCAQDAKRREQEARGKERKERSDKEARRMAKMLRLSQKPRAKKRRVQANIRTAVEKRRARRLAVETRAKYAAIRHTQGA